MDEIEKTYKKYFDGEISIHELLVRVPLTQHVTDPNDRVRYKVIVNKFWRDFVYKQSCMETSFNPDHKLSPSDFLQMMLHYVQIKRAYGE